MRRLVLVVVLALLPVSAARGAATPPLLAGVGQADITPPTGSAFGGWTRADRVGQGVHTRLEASAIVLQRGDRKFALVSVDLFAATGGLVKEAAERNADLGFSERNLRIRWRVDADGRYTGEWLVLPGTAPGTFRVVVTARCYRLESEPFTR